MKLLRLNMYKKINYIVAVMILVTSLSVKAQVTSQSPYSKYGLGNVKGMLLPQFRAMGGISTGVYKPNGYSNINMQNPATYSGISMATVDIGVSTEFKQLKQGSLTEGSFNGTLSHMALAFPIKATRTGISFGLLPFTDVGYKYGGTTGYQSNGTGGLDSNSFAKRYSGEGGLNKAYFGLGQQFGDYFRIGANVEYVFGNLVGTESIEPQSYAAYNSRQQIKNSIGGLGFSYGAQFEIPLSSKSRITLGYSGSSSSSINSKVTSVLTRYQFDSQGQEDPSRLTDTISMIQGASTKLKLPLMHNFGFSIQRDNKWLVGADFRTGKWSKLSIDGVNNGLQDSWGFSAGGQITPDINSIGSYFNLIDYRAGFIYDKTYMQINNQDIKQMAVTFGLGLPLARVRYAVYKVNLTTELGRRGTMNNGLVQENYINIHLGFTLNDTWFQRFKFN
jgi:hypothetical protein